MGFADTRLRKLSIGLRVSPPVFTLPHSHSLSFSLFLAVPFTNRTLSLSRALSLLFYS